MTRHSFARPFVALATFAVLAASIVPVSASCLAVADARSQPTRSDVAATPETVDVTFLGHSSFLIRTAEDVTAVTDYNGYIRADAPPDIVTMNHAHGTHYTDNVEPGVAHILRGWDSGEGIPQHNVLMRDLRVRNVPTNIRDAFAGTEFAGNSIFVFETVGLCIAHLGHLHHQLEPEHIAQLGVIDVLLAPIDDGYTMAQTGVVEVIETLRPSVVIPMHYAGPWLLGSFAAMMRERGWTIREQASPSIRLSRAELPHKTVLVLPSGVF